MQYSDHDFAENEPNPIMHLNYKLGYPTCIVILIALSMMFRVLAFLALKKFTRDNIWCWPTIDNYLVALIIKNTKSLICMDGVLGFWGY